MAKRSVKKVVETSYVPAFVTDLYDSVSGGVCYAYDGIGTGAVAVGNGAVSVYDTVADNVVYIGNKIADGAKVVGKTAVDTADVINECIPAFCEGFLIGGTAAVMVYGLVFLLIANPIMFDLLLLAALIRILYAIVEGL